MNVELPFIPERSKKIRESGITMIMDKGLSSIEAESFAESSAEFTDLVKFGFGTALIAKAVEKKIEIYKQAQLRPYFGGTLFEAFFIRNKFDDFRRLVSKYKLDLIEISDGSMAMDHDKKLEAIHEMSKEVTVISEVGSKVKGVEISAEKWVKMMKTELEAGSWKVIAEARESGTIGIYNEDGSANKALIQEIIDHLRSEAVLWEAPNKNQQTYFIRLLGANVNLGNIAPTEVVALEALRLGLRGDTFFDFLPEHLQKFKQ
jgi:phosphosulfolactate synthase